jgi:kynurenine aminotransferase
MASSSRRRDWLLQVQMSGSFENSYINFYVSDKYRSLVNEAGFKSPIQPIVHMGQGFFGYNPPDFLIQAAQAAMERIDCNQYAPTRGRPRLKKAIADAYSPFFPGRTLDPEKNVTITTGANEGMLSAFMAFLETGDEVIVFEPFFDQYIGNIVMAGAKVVYVPMIPPETTNTSSASDWKIDMEALVDAITPRTRMIVLNTPHNPIGKIFSRDELLSIGALAEKYNLIIISDEVYDKLYYKDEFVRIATLSEDLWNRTLSISSGGKIFYATGWRIGWLIGPEHLINHVARAHTLICYSTPSPLQEATAIGLEEAEKHNFWQVSRAEMKSKVDRFTAIWAELGIPYSDPDGGYFVLVNLSKVKLPEDLEYPDYVLNSGTRDFKLMWFLTTRLGVAVIPTTMFYTKRNAKSAENWLRFAVCKEDDVLEKGKERLRELKKYIE